MMRQFLDGIGQDVAFAVRSLRRAPGLTAGVVLTLALGLGVNMAMVSFLDVVFLRAPAGVRDPGQVRRVWTEIHFRSGAQFWSGFSYPQYAAVRSALGDRVATALYRHPQKSRFGSPDHELQARVSLASATYFDLLGVHPALGRFYAIDEDRLGAAAPVAVASHAFWQNHLSADAAALGQTLTIAGRTYTLIGVAAEGFSGVELDATDVWLPLATEPNFGPTPWWQTHNVNGFQILVRPKDAVAAGTLEQRIAAALRTPEALMRPADSANAVRLGSIVRAQGPGKKDQEVQIATRLAGVTIIVLLIACANVVNLLLARAVRRRREIAVRLAVGISRTRLMRLLLTESVILAMAAALASVLTAYWGGTMLRVLLLPDVSWAEGSSPLHWHVLALAMAAGLVAGVVAGVLPAVQAAKTELTAALKAGSSDGRARSSRAHTVLVVAQAALSVVLLVGAGLFVRSLTNIQHLRIGYDTPRILYGGVEYDARDSVRDARRPQALRDVAERMRQVRGVEEVGLAMMAPTRGFGALDIYPDVDTTAFPKPFATYNMVSPEFFAATGMHILRGTTFPPVRGTAMPPVVVINDAMARAQWPGMDALGRCLRFAPAGECYRVIGIVETAMFDKLVEIAQPQYYLSIENPPREARSRVSTVVVRSDPAARDRVSAELRRVLRETFPGGRPTLNTMEEFLEPQYRPWRLGATLFTAFGILALIVAIVGIYSTVAYAVTQRSHEFGVRTALGAQMMDILRQVIGGSLRTVAIGVVAGIALAVAGARLVASLLYGIEPTDPGVMITVSAMLLLIAALAALGPAWRAARVDPVTALRAD